MYKEKNEKLAKRLHLVKQRYESLEKRRGLEVEGFKNDIKILRTRLKDVEKQLFKVILFVKFCFVSKNVMGTFLLSVSNIELLEIEIR